MARVIPIRQWQRLGGKAISLNGSSDYLQCPAFDEINDWPMSYSCFFNTFDHFSDSTLMSLSDDQQNNTYHRIEINENTPGGLECEARDGLSPHISTYVFPSYNSGRWYQASGIYRGITDRQSYGNGNAGELNVQGTTFSGNAGVPRIFSIGALKRTSLVQLLRGSISNVAVWRTIRSENEIKQLALGIDPREIDYSNLVAYWPLSGNFLNYAFTGRKYDLTVFGSPSWTTGPLVQTRPRTTYITVPAPVVTEYQPRFPILRPTVIRGGSSYAR